MCPLSPQAQTPMPGNGTHLCSCNGSFPLITQLQNGCLVLHSRENTQWSPPLGPQSAVLGGQVATMAWTFLASERAVA